jgi:hypothetical protein
MAMKHVAFGVAMLALGGATFGTLAVEVSRPHSLATPSTQKARAVEASSASHVLRGGVITRVDLANSRIEIEGQWCSIVWGQTQLFQQGHSARPDALKAGMAVKFSVSEGEAGAKRLGVLYAP